MSLRPVEDPDPLLAFANEPAVAESSAPPLEPALQPAAATEDRLPVRQPPDPVRALTARVDTLERALDESKSQIAALKSDMATLVRALADIRKQPARPASPAMPAVSSRPRVPVGTAPKIAGLVIGVVLGVGAWMYLSNDTDATLVAPATAAVAAAQPAVLVPAAVTVDPEPAAPAPIVMKADNRDTRSPVQDVNRTTFVGTLSIDASPGGEVFLNRKSAGSTPLRLTNLRAGSHLIWIERDGYRRWTRVVRVPADRVTRLSADLEPLAAR